MLKNTYIKHQRFCIQEEQLHCCVLFQEGDSLNIKPVKSL